MRLKRTSFVVGVALAAILALVAAQTATAATLIVASLGDDADDPTTLRGAIAQAADGDTIQITAEGTIFLEQPVVIDKALTIVGPGQGSLAVDGGYDPEVEGTGVPVLLVGVNSPDITVSISGLTITHGSAADGGGGGVLNRATLTLTDCTLTGNRAYGGGAVANTGVLTLIGCTLTDNQAVELGGAILNTDVMSQDEEAGKAVLTVSRCALTGNRVTAPFSYGAGGGAVANFSLVATSSLIIEDSTLNGNSAPWGGAINNVSATGNATASIVRSTLSGNSAAADMGTALGGAIAQFIAGDEATLTVDSCTLNDNQAVCPVSAAGGAIGTFGLPGVNGSNVILRNSTLVRNSALFSDDSPEVVAAGAVGGALAISFAAATIDNCTLSGNVDAGVVGDDWSVGNGPRASGILAGDGGSATVKNTILANDSSGPNLTALQDTDSGVPGTITSAGYNLSTDDGSDFLTATGDMTNTIPMLGQLQDNGGPTMTMALPSDSPAIDAAASTDSAGIDVKVDQRGVTRPQGSANDIGAFELEAPQTSALSVYGATATSPNPKSPNVTVTVLIRNDNDTTAYDVAVTAASLGGVDTKSSLPLVYGALKPGASKKVTLQFKGVSSGDQSFTVQGTSSLGDFLTSQTVTVP